MDEITNACDRTSARGGGGGAGARGRGRQRRASGVRSRRPSRRSQHSYPNAPVNNRVRLGIEGLGAAGETGFKNASELHDRVVVDHLRISRKEREVRDEESNGPHGAREYTKRKRHASAWTHLPSLIEADNGRVVRPVSARDRRVVAHPKAIHTRNWSGRSDSPLPASHRER